MNQAILQTNPYYYNEVIALVKEYSTSNPFFPGIYLTESDAFITKSYKYTAETYLSHVLDAGELPNFDDLLRFFTEEESARLRFASTAGRSSKGPEVFLIGVPANAGSARSPALFVYSMDSGSIDTALFSSPGAYAAQYGIFSGDTHELLIASPQGESLQEMAEWIDFDQTSADGSTIERDGRQFALFAVRDTSLGHYFVAAAPYDEIQQSAYDYYNAMRVILLTGTAVLLLLLAVLIYVNYRPILQIARKIRPDSGGELDAISNAIDSMTNELNEQNMLIKDYLLGNILYGKPIHEKDLSRLGISGYTGFYRVCTISDISLTTGDRIGLTNTALQDFSIPIFITDIWR